MVKYKDGIQAVESGARKAVSVIPNDSTDLTNGITKGIYVGVSGNLSITMADGTNVQFVNLASGIIHPIQCKRVRSSSTTATNILAVY